MQIVNVIGSNLMDTYCMHYLQINIDAADKLHRGNNRKVSNQEMTATRIQLIMQLSVDVHWPTNTIS